MLILRHALCTALLLVGVTACTSNWKIHGGPQECVQMCTRWNMKMTGMVGVGNQDRTGEGATACVCEVPTSGGTGGTEPVAAAGTATSTAAVVVALEAAQQQQQQLPAQVVH